MTLTTDQASVSSKRQNFFITQDEVAQAIAELQAKGIDIPRGFGIHFVNLRNMWRHNRSRYVPCAAYAKGMGIGAKAVRETVHALAASEGLVADTVKESGRVIGLMLVNSKPGASQKQAQSYRSGAVKTPNDTTTSGLGTVRPAVLGPSDQRSRDRAIDEYSSSSSIDELINEQDLSAAQCATPPVPRVKSLLIIETAVAQYEARQKQLDGIRTDGRTIDSLLQQTVGWDDADIAQACAVALHVTQAWAWSQGRPSSCPAGQAIGAAINAQIWSPVPGETCTPDVDVAYTWDDEHRTFVDSVGCDLFDREIQPITSLIEAPSALDTKEQPPSTLNTLLEAPSAPVEPLVTALACDVPACPVEAVQSAPEPLPLITTQIAPETRKTPVAIESDADRMARLRAAALKQVAALNLSPSTGRYGTPANDCGEHYFAQLSNTALLIRDDDNFDF